MQAACQGLVGGPSTLRLRSRGPSAVPGGWWRTFVSESLRAERRAELEARPAVEARLREVPQRRKGAPASHGRLRSGVPTDSHQAG